MVDRLKNISLYLFLGLLAYMPVHIFLSTWIGTSLGILPLTKIFKDMLLVVGFLLALAASIPKSWFKELFAHTLVWVILAYSALTILLALLKPTDGDAEILGVTYNLRFLLFFLYAVLLSQLYKNSDLKKKALKLVMGVGAAVLVFGLAQYLLLSSTALMHIGYSRENGVLPAFFIDDKPDLERIMSTLRDPNSFGSFCIILLLLGFAYVVTGRRKESKMVVVGIIALSGLCLLLTFSRSALLGALLALGVFAAMHFEKERSTKIRKKVLVIASSVMVITLLVLVPLRNTYFVKNVIFHADENTTMEDSNELRLRFWHESLEESLEEPQGHGPGTAGLASIKNETQGTVLNENYYLQILHEVGFIGLGLFLAVLIAVGMAMYRQAQVDVWALGLLASFIGLGLANCFVHIWSNEAVAYTWWGLTGLVLAPLWQKSRPHSRLG